MKVGIKMAPNMISIKEIFKDFQGPTKKTQKIRRDVVINK